MEIKDTFVTKLNYERKIVMSLKINPFSCQILNSLLAWLLPSRSPQFPRYLCHRYPDLQTEIIRYHPSYLRYYPPFSLTATELNQLQDLNHTFSKEVSG